MKVGLRFSLVGALVLVTLSGCGRGFFQEAERAPWRHDAEIACMKSGVVKLGQGAVQIEPIEGPGACGADFPLRVTGLGETSALGFADEVPPSRERLRWVVGPQPVNAPDDEAPAGEPMSLAAPEPTPPSYAPPQSAPSYAPSQRTTPYYVPPRNYVPQRAVPSYAPPIARSLPEPQARAMPDDIPPDAIIPPGGSAAVPEGPERPSYRVAPPPPRRAYNAPDYEPPRPPPRLGPAPNYSPASIPQATLTPPATLSCPIVSALDHWVSEGVQPAALHWFGSPVVTIRQIGAYSCRSMIGAASHHISEHAFGDALDIAAFAFADGRTVTVKNGWHGSPAEQGFLHDVQLYACETFTTVLAPGYNPEHYNHIHVDLMRRASGRRPCRPTAIAGEIVAARARAHYASHQRGPTYTGSIAAMIDKMNKEQLAVPGADGYVGDDDDADASAAAPSVKPQTPRPFERQTHIY
jgi:hypothetical protein